MRCSELASRRLPPQVGLFDALLLHWLVVGALVLMLAPAWQHAWLGWLPYWLVLVPAALLGWRWTVARHRRLYPAPVLVAQPEYGSAPKWSRRCWTERRVTTASPMRSRIRSKPRRERTAIRSS